MNKPLRCKHISRMGEPPHYVEWYIKEQILSACEYLKDKLGNECDKEVEEAFEILYKEIK